MTRPDTSADLRDVLLGIIEVQPVASVLQRLARAAMDLTGADNAALGAYDDERRLQHFEAVGVSPEQREAMGDPPSGIGLLGEFAVHPRTINELSMRDHPSASGVPEGHPAMEAFLGVPVLYGGRAVGAFYVTRKPGAAGFTADDQTQLESLAPYAAIAINNARTLEAEGERADVAEMLARAARGLRAAMDERTTARILLGAMGQLLPDATGYGVYWTAPDSPEVQRETTDNENEPTAHVLEHLGDLPDGEHRLPLKARDDELSIQVVTLAGGGRFAAAVTAPESLHGLQRVSLRAIHELGVIGMTALHRLDAEAALDRYQMRDAVARDLHDGIIQAVYAVGLELHAAHPGDAETRELLARANEDLNGVIADLRGYIQELTRDPQAELPPEALAIRLRSLVATRRGETAWTVDLRLDDLELGAQQERELFMIARELVSNVERHAAAQRASLSVRRNGETIRLEVHDDGIGFDRAAVVDTGLGIRSVEQRVGDLGGSVVFESTPGEGTVVTAEIPIAERDEAAG